MTAVNGQSFLCPLSMATGYLSVLLQSLGGAALGLWCSQKSSIVAGLASETTQKKDRMPVSKGKGATTVC